VNFLLRGDNMKHVFNFLVALGMLLILEFMMMLLYNTFARDQISVDTLVGKIFFGSTAVILASGFLFMLIKAQVMYMRTGKLKKSDTIK